MNAMQDTSIDEQMVPFSGWVPGKQVTKTKPNPVGVKIFALCSKDVVAHDFEIYQGKGTGVHTAFWHLGLGGSIVMQLEQSLQERENLRCFFDNYFTYVPLFKLQWILARGTIRTNRLSGCPLKSEKELRRNGREAVTALSPRTVTLWL